ncbi:transposase [candidate division MSBL1 archaeon SCGC-AAA259E19]|uniref:Transposase n=1 Tax=candidate division MSBL1 archaeon SCGC-AAA259E19 TaxID=1698264 RepID=A0A133UGX3_9EURY|nr:transposase [candidate division MSBL1 archaeon SCGC-AAA259E19]
MNGMKITRKRAKKLYKVLEEEKEKIREESKEEGDEYPYGKWERERKEIVERLQDLPDLVEEAASQLEVERPKRGRKQKLDPAQKTMLFLFARLTQKSNRDMEIILSMLGPVFGVNVSYKTIERLYSDEEVRMVLHNLFLLLLEKSDVSGDCSGDGTGYSLQTGKHYRSESKKNGDKYRHIFRLVDLKTGMYIGYGYSNKSEKETFKRAVEFVKKHDIPFHKVRLDKYYSNKKDIRELGEDAEAFVLPKEVLSNFGYEWHEILNRIKEDPYGFLKDYFKRELSETYFGADKERFGRKISQRREGRRETASFATAILHNLFTIRLPPS